MLSMQLAPFKRQIAQYRSVLRRESLQGEGLSIPDWLLGERWDEPVYPAIIGVIEREQLDGKKEIRNDRLIAVAECAHECANVKLLSDQSVELALRGVKKTQILLQNNAEGCPSVEAPALRTNLILVD